MYLLNIKYTKSFKIKYYTVLKINLYYCKSFKIHLLKTADVSELLKRVNACINALYLITLPVISQMITNYIKYMY